MTHPLKGFIEMLMQQEQEQEPEVKEIRVGSVSPGQATRLESLIKEHEVEHDNMDKKIKAYIKVLDEEARKYAEVLNDRTQAYISQLEKEHEPLCKAFSEQQDQIWDEIYNALDLSPEERLLDYGISDIGDVSRLEEIEEIPKETHQRNNQVH